MFAYNISAKINSIFPTVIGTIYENLPKVIYLILWIALGLK